MKIIPALCLASLSASTGANTVARDHPHWMVGQWAWVSPTQKLRRGDCPESEFYGRNGYVTDGESASRWWIEGETYLVRVTIEPGYGGSPSEIGRKYRQRFRKIEPGKLAFRDDGVLQWLVRCGDVPRKWGYRPQK